MSDQRVLAPAQQIRHELEQMGSQFKLVLPPTVTPDAFTRVAMMAIADEPKLLGVPRNNLFNELLKCARDGLMPIAPEAKLIIYGNTCQYSPMIGGIVKKLHENNHIKETVQEVVYASDGFRRWTDETGLRFTHEINDLQERGEPVAVYALVIMKDVGRYFEFMTAREVMAAKSKSKGSNSPSSPWNGPFEGEMWKKTVLRRLCKRIPGNSRLLEMFHHEDEETHHEPAKDAIKAESVQMPAKDVTPHRAPSPSADDAKQQEVKTERDEALEKPAAAVHKGPPYNYAPNSDNPPPPMDPRKKTDYIPRREDMGPVTLDRLRRLYPTRLQAEEFVRHTTGKKLSELSNREMFDFYYDKVLPAVEAQEKGMPQ
jgi:recombination protein RecT